MDPLDNIVGIHAECAEKQFQKSNPGLVLKPGDYVKIGFNDHIDGEVITEHMWIKVTEIMNNNTYLGELDNDPVYLTNVHCGLPTVFNVKEVAEILKD